MQFTRRVRTVVRRHDRARARVPVPAAGGHRRAVVQHGRVRCRGRRRASRCTGGSRRSHSTGARDALIVSLKTACGATAIALVLGLLAALAVQRFKFFGRESLNLMIVLPIALPGIVTGIALNAAFRQAGSRVRLADADHRPRHVLHRRALQQPAGPLAPVVARTWKRRRPTSARTRSRRFATSPSRCCARRCWPAGCWRSVSASTRSSSPRSPSGAGLETLPIWIFRNLSRGEQQPIVTVVATRRDADVDHPGVGRAATDHRRRTPHRRYPLNPPR